MIFTGNFGNHSRKKWFSVAVLLAIFCGIFSTEAWAQTPATVTDTVSWSEVAALSDYTVKFTTQDATCYDNGQLGFIIVPITDSVEVSSLDMQKFGIGFKGTVLDTTMRWYRNILYDYSDTTWVPMEAGSYNITFEFLIWVDNTTGYVKVDTVVTDTLTVNLLYQEPIVKALSKTSLDGVSLGNIPSLLCSEGDYQSGRIQVRVDGGNYPMDFWVVKHVPEGTPLPHDTVRHAMYWPDHVTVVDYNNNQPTNPKTLPRSTTTGDSTRADYYRYFSFDNLPAGEYDFYFTDACGYGFDHPATIQSIGTVNPPTLRDVEIYASSGNIADYNVVKIKPLLSLYEYPVYLKQYAPYIEYRFNFPAPSYHDDFPWKKLFPNGLPASYDGSETPNVILYDTFANEKYCEIWDVKDMLELRIIDGSNLCPLTSWDTFSVHNTNPKKYIYDSVWVVDDATQLSQCELQTTKHVESISFRYSENQPNKHPADHEGDVYRYHFTYPIVWTFQEAGSQRLIKRDTIWGVSSTDRINRKSVLTKEDIQAEIDTFSTTLNLQYTLRDAKGCLLYGGQRQIYMPTIVEVSGDPTWKATAVYDACGNKLRSFTIKELNGMPDADYDGTVVRLWSSPGNNFNFTATYSSDNGWSSTTDNFPGPTISYLSDGMGVTISGFLAPGQYRFYVKAPCNDSINITERMPDSKYTAIENGHAHLVYDCIQEYVTFPHAQIKSVKVQANGTEVSTPMTTCFKMVAGPVGGYDPMNTDTLYAGSNGHPGDSIRLSVPTDPNNPYIFQIYPLYPNNLCSPKVFYDTVWYTGSNLTFDFAMAFKCDENSPTGTVYLMAKNGKPPYQYTLFDADGDTLAKVKTDTLYGPDGELSDTLKLYDVPMYVDSMLSCYIKDDCGNYFTVKFFPQTLSELQKIWFDNRAKTLESCEGTYVRIHTLSAGNIFSYKWYKIMNGQQEELLEETSDPEYFLPRGSDTAIYKVKIMVPGCDNAVFSDSVTIYPKQAPLLTMTVDTNEVCYGEPAVVSFTPTSFNTSNNLVTFSVVYKTLMGADTIEYKDIPSGTTVTETINPTMKTAIYPISINDNRCDYKVADTTLYVKISDHFISPCIISTWNDTVCLGHNALLRASCSDPATPTNPNIIRWYNDFSLTDSTGVKYEQKSNEVNDASEYVLYAPSERTIRYVTVEKNGFCRPNHLTSDSLVTLSGIEDTTYLTCTSSVLFTDDGGLDMKYSTDASGDTYYTRLFYTESIPVTIHFDTLALGEGASLMIFSGGELNEDSLLAHYTGNSEGFEMLTSDVIVSKGNKMLVYFRPGMNADIGWKAYVRPSPGIAIADVSLPKNKTYTERVCQSQSKTKDDLDEDFVNLSIASEAQLEAAIKSAGTYYWRNMTNSGLTGCDSITTQKLVVYPATRTDTFAIITNNDNLTWEGSTYNKQGIYEKHFEDAAGCDYYKVLKLIVIEVNIPEKNVCFGEDAVVGITVKTHDSVLTAGSVKYTAVGDIMGSYTDENGNTSVKPYRIDDFLAFADSLVHNTEYDINDADFPLKPYGVVVYVDPQNSNHGKAISIVDASDSLAYNPVTKKYNQLFWAKPEQKKLVNAKTCVTNTEMGKARSDFEGDSNTIYIQKSVIKNNGDLTTWAPAAYHCIYYNPDNYGLGDPGDWYLPACGELYFCFAYRDVINSSLHRLKERGFAHVDLLKGGVDDMYWSSTEVRKGEEKIIAAGINGKGQIVLHANKDSSDKTRSFAFKVRAMIAF